MPIGQITSVKLRITFPAKVRMTSFVLYISQSFPRPASVHVVIMSMNTENQASPEESPTRYMLPEQVDEEGKGLVDYSLNEYSPARYPIATNKKDKDYSNTDYSCGPYSPASYRFSKKKKRKATQNKESKKKKAKPGKTVQFYSKVILKTSDLTELELSHEEEYDQRHSDFTVKRARQKQWMKLHHQQRPMTPKRLKIQATIQRENGNA